MPDGGDVPDASSPDAGTPDASTPDGGSPDAGNPDAGDDAGTPDAGDAGPGDGLTCNWTQWGQDPSHAGNACVGAQSPARALARVVFDPFVPLEQAEDPEGDLVAHFPTPLLSGDDAYLMVKSGSYLPCEPPGSGTTADGGTFCGSGAWGSQSWNEKRFHWESGTLVEKWSFASDWKPVPVDLAGWEPVFQAALSRGVLYVPGQGGTVFKVDRLTGQQIARINPFGTVVDPNTFVAGGLTVDAQGNVYYNALALDPAAPDGDAAGWLVKVAPDGGSAKVSYAVLTPGAPAPTDTCLKPYNRIDYERPFPPVSDAGVVLPPPTGPCLSQRPGLNAAPTIGPDGTVFTVSRAHLNGRYSYVVAVHPDLTPKWTASLRGILHDGCGVLIPSDADPDGGRRLSHCRVGTTVGVDPATNDAPAGIVDDASSSSPVALPDGTVIYGALTGYNTSRGHLFRFSASGSPMGTYDFGWDVTPAYFRHNGSYSIVIKDNHYFFWDGSAPRYQITQLSPSLVPEWQFKNTNTQACHRLDDGGISCTTQTCTPLPDGGQDCVADNPDGFEWCINAPAVDASGVVYANAEDGFLYAINQGGTEKAHLFLKLALGAAYTPLSIDYAGRIYALNGGELTVVGQ
jgi:hypothetical protein